MHFSRRAALACALLVLVACASTSPTTRQRTFDSPEQAMTALVDAIQREDREELHRIFGPRTDELKSGDEAQDVRERTLFTRAVERGHAIEPQSDERAILLVGEDRWPFSVPLVREGSIWHFDTDEGIDELSNRRIGLNELRSIAACRALFLAQLEYFSADRNDDGVREYARRLVSTPGQKDGLYWPSIGGVDPSPIGPALALAAAQRDAENEPLPFYGYHYKALYRQGPSAPGGALSYEDGGRLTRGWGVLAYPAEYGVSGVMSFLVSSEGRIYERDLGEDTAEMALALEAFEPSEGWRPVAP